MSFTDRFRYLLAKQGPALAVALLVLAAALLAGAGLVYAERPTTEITDHRDQQTVTTGLTTAATVTGNSSVYERGQRLEGQPVYLFSATPDTDLTLTTALPADVGGSVSHNLTLVYGASRDGDRFWEHAEPLPLHTTTRDGETASTTTVSMPAVRDRVEHYRTAFGTAATIDVALRVRADYSVGQYSGEVSEQFPLSFGDRWYSIESRSVSNSHSTPVTSVRALPLGDHLPFVVPFTAGVVFLLAGLVVGGAVWRLGGRVATDAADRVHHARYAAWISEGSLPAAAGPTVEMASLEALVDVAIDTGNRVVYDPDRGYYAVLDAGTRYRYGTD
jgi:hypothetical protein